MQRIIFWNDHEWFKEPICLGPLRLNQVGEAYVGSCMPVSEHTQVCYEINLVTSGQCVHNGDGQKHLLRRGEMALSCRDKAHGLALEGAEQLRFWFLAFDFDESHPDFEMVRPMRDYFESHCGAKARDSRGLSGQLALLLQEVDRGRPVREAALYGLMLQILSNIYRDYLDLPEEVRAEDTVSRILHYIDAHYADMRHLNEIASALDQSYAYLARSFLQATGMTMGQYYKKKRFEEAVSMMERGISFSFIAERLGYSTVSAFSKAFTAHFGMSPSAYKKRE